METILKNFHDGCHKVLGTWLIIRVGPLSLTDCILVGFSSKLGRGAISWPSARGLAGSPDLGTQAEVRLNVGSTNDQQITNVDLFATGTASRSVAHGASLHVLETASTHHVRAVLKSNEVFKRRDADRASCRSNIL